MVGFVVGKEELRRRLNDIQNAARQWLMIALGMANIPAELAKQVESAKREFALFLEGEEEKEALKKLARHNADTAIARVKRELEEIKNQPIESYFGNADRFAVTCLATGVYLYKSTSCLSTEAQNIMQESAVQLGLRPTAADSHFYVLNSKFQAQQEPAAYSPNVKSEQSLKLQQQKQALMQIKNINDLQREGNIESLRIIGIKHIVCVGNIILASHDITNPLLVLFAMARMASVVSPYAAKHLDEARLDLAQSYLSIDSVKAFEPMPAVMPRYMEDMLRQRSNTVPFLR